MHPERVRCKVSLATPKRLWQRPWEPCRWWPSRPWSSPGVSGALWLLIVPANAQLTDISQTPNRERWHPKSLDDQIGAGRATW
jgi:hypothetical protein